VAPRRRAYATWNFSEMAPAKLSEQKNKAPHCHSRAITTSRRAFRCNGLRLRTAVQDIPVERTFQPLELELPGCGWAPSIFYSSISSDPDPVSDSDYYYGLRATTAYGMCDVRCAGCG
jgi:hypothetical protein